MYFGIDLGGTKLMVLVGTDEGRIIGERVIPAPSRRKPEQVIATITNLSIKLMTDLGIHKNRILGAGFAVAGAVDLARGTVIDSPHLQRIVEYPLADMLQEALNMPIVIGNDANFAALAEHRLGAGQGESNLVFITISTGIGAGIIVENRLFTGSDGFGGEVGHITVDANGPYGKSRNPGALESLASGSAIARIASERLSSGEISIIGSGTGQKDKTRVTAESVFVAFHQKDPLATTIIDEAVNYLGAGLTSIVNILNPSTIIIGGGLSNEWDSYIQPAVNRMRENAFGGMGKRIKVHPSYLGPQSGAIGAILQVSEMLSASPLPSI